MIRNCLIFSICILLSVLECNAQNEIKACILQIESGNAYLDVTAPKVKVGDVLSVYSEAGYMIHPVTKQKIKKEGEILADLEIVEIKSGYSVATIYPEIALSKLKSGMVASMPEVLQEMTDEVVEEEFVADDMTYEQPLTADGIINRYLEVTGLKKMVGKPFSMTKEESFKLKKKFRKYSVSLMVDPQSKKLLFKRSNKDVALDNLVYAINGPVGWWGLLGATKEFKDGEANNMFLAYSDPFLLRAFLGTDVKTMCGNKYIDGEMCTGIEICGAGYNDRIRYYFSEATGYLLLEERTGEFAYRTVASLGLKPDEISSYEISYSGYRKFNELTLSSNKHLNIVTLGGRKIESYGILQDVTLGNVTFGNSLSKDGVKQILKEMRKSK